MNVWDVFCKIIHVFVELWTSVIISFNNKTFFFSFLHCTSLVYKCTINGVGLVWKEEKRREKKSVWFQFFIVTNDNNKLFKMRNEMLHLQNSFTHQLNHFIFTESKYKLKLKTNANAEILFQNEFIAQSNVNTETHSTWKCVVESVFHSWVTDFINIVQLLKWLRQTQTSHKKLGRRCSQNPYFKNHSRSHWLRPKPWVQSSSHRKPTNCSEQHRTLTLNASN